MKRSNQATTAGNTSHKVPSSCLKGLLAWGSFDDVWQGCPRGHARPSCATAWEPPQRLVPCAVGETRGPLRKPGLTPWGGSRILRPSSPTAHRDGPPADRKTTVEPRGLVLHLGRRQPFCGPRSRLRRQGRRRPASYKCLGQASNRSRKRMASSAPLGPIFSGGFFLRAGCGRSAAGLCAVHIVRLGGFPGVGVQGRAAVAVELQQQATTLASKRPVRDVRRRTALRHRTERLPRDGPWARMLKHFTPSREGTARS